MDPSVQMALKMLLRKKVEDLSETNYIYNGTLEYKLERGKAQYNEQ